VKNSRGLEILTDDVERMHQVAGDFEARSSKLKSATGRAAAQSKMEAMSHNNLFWQHMQLSQQLSKRKLDVNSIKKEEIKILKTEHDQKQLKSLDQIEQNPIPKLITAYDKLKHETRNPKN
jgi:hypothetical protein